jgi:hypothetical protein
MSDDAKLARHRVAEGTLQSLARRIDKALPEGICFALVTFTVGDGGYAGYVSNGQRADMIKALRECATVLEIKADMPPGAPLRKN